MSLRFAGSAYLPLGEDTFMWVLTVSFAVSASPTNRAVIQSIIQAPQYGYDFASPFDGYAASPTPDLHGRWWRRHIGVEQFEACSAVAAVDVVRRWATEQEWAEADFALPPEVLEKLEDVYADLLRGVVYQLRNPSVECEHEYGWVPGGMGFHEFIVIDTDRHEAKLIVACDD
jgi:hypothetical protein